MGQNQVNTLTRAWRHLARDVTRDVTVTSGRSASESWVCQILNFENRIIIKGDTAIFVKAYKKNFCGGVRIFEVAQEASFLLIFQVDSAISGQKNPYSYIELAQ